MPSNSEPSKQFGVPLEVGAGKSDVVADDVVEGGISSEKVVLIVCCPEAEVVTTIGLDVGFV